MEWRGGSCEHEKMTEPPKDRRDQPLPWFTLTEPATEVLRKVVMDPKWLQSMSYYVTFRSVSIFLWVEMRYGHIHA